MIGCSTRSILRRIKTLILPNIAALSDAQCDQLRAFVARGGNLVCTYETSLYDESGARRKNFALADLFGVDWTGKREGPMLNSYIRLEHDALPHHALFTGLEDAPRIINGVSRLEVTPREKFAETPLTLIPSYPDLPMEKVYPRTSRTDVSCLYLRQHAGRVAYFPFDIDRTFWEVLAEDHLKVLRNTLAWAHREEPVVTVEGPGLIDVTVWQNPGSITVHLVNLTNPMTMKGPYRDFFPIGAQTVTLRLGGDVHPKTARLLVADRSISMERTGSTFTSPCRRCSTMKSWLSISKIYAREAVALPFLLSSPQGTCCQIPVTLRLWQTEPASTISGSTFSPAVPGIFTSA